MLTLSVDRLVLESLETQTNVTTIKMNLKEALAYKEETASTRGIKNENHNRLVM